MSAIDAPSGGLMGRRTRKKKADDDDDSVPQVSSQQVAITKMAKDMAELEMSPTVELVADKADKYLKFSFIIRPVDGYWAGGKFEFKFEIPNNYPWGAPSVTCVDSLWHPNIDLDGKPCVNVLQKNWKPTFTIQTVMFALMFLFSDPNPLDPLNVDAAEEMRAKPAEFAANVVKALKGGNVHGHSFPVNQGGNPALIGTKK